MLPLSSWWLNLVKVDDEVIGIRKRVLYVGMLQGEVQSTTFLIPITLAFASNQFGYPKEVGRLFLRNVGTTFYHTRTITQKTIIWAAAVVEAQTFKSTLLPIFFCTEDPLTSCVHSERVRELQADDPCYYLFTVSNARVRRPSEWTVNGRRFNDNRCWATVHVLHVTDNNSQDTCVRCSF